MRRSVKLRTDINILRISLDAPEALSENDRSRLLLKKGGSSVTFELLLRGQVAFQASINARRLGFTKQGHYSAHRYRYTEPKFSVPKNLILKLAEASRHAREGLLWLELDPPDSRLSFVPWEDLLRPALPVLLLRLPQYSLFESSPVPDPLDVVLCSSSPQAKAEIPTYQIVKELTRVLIESSLQPITVHIFTDKKDYASLKSWLLPERGGEGISGVRLYDPSRVEYQPAELSKTVSDDPAQLDNPWLNWMADSLPGRAISVVHFACHGYFSMGRGALAFAESPSSNRDKSWARFVGARQLNTFLNRIGASAVSLASPPRNYSIIGLRLLTAQLARLRPGAVFMHGFDNNAHWQDAVMEFYLSLLSKYIFHLDQRRGFSYLNEGCFYCPPSLVYGAEMSGLVLEAAPDLTETVSVINALNKANEGDNVWMTSSRRTIERATSELLASAPISERQGATHVGISHALEFVSDVLRRHAGLGGGDSSTREDKKLS